MIVNNAPGCMRNASAVMNFRRVELDAYGIDNGVMVVIAKDGKASAIICEGNPAYIGNIVSRALTKDPGMAYSIRG